MWIKSKDKLPEQDQWCWICDAKNFIERGCFDTSLTKWVIYEGDYIWGPDKIVHWQPYYTPAPPNAIEDFLRGFKNDV